MWVCVVKNSLPKDHFPIAEGKGQTFAFSYWEVIFKPLEGLPSESVSVCQEASATEWSNNVICEGGFEIMPYQF